jgi:hypothetical protein
MKDPILAKRSLFKGSIVVNGGLHYIKGNKLPYFSLTAVEYDKRGRDVAGGAMHDRIVELFPRFRDLADMHLSDMNGVPMHAVENGWYFAKGGQFMGERWMQVNKDCTPEENLEKCQASLAKLLRITWDEAEPLMALGQLWREYKKADWDNDVERDLHAETCRKAFVGLVNDMKPRWKGEALDCIQKFGLEVYGDPWLEPVTEEDGAGYDGTIAKGEG